jgi:hypothetical protein
VVAYAVLSTPDDGCKEHPKHVERSCSEIKHRLLTAASRWKLTNIRFVMHGAMNVKKVNILYCFLNGLTILILHFNTIFAHLDIFRFFFFAGYLLEYGRKRPIHVAGLHHVCILMYLITAQLSEWACYLVLLQEHG